METMYNIGSARNLDRIPLWKVVPLAVPFSVAISVSDVCNFKCSYCNHATPQGVRGGRLMSLEEFYSVSGKIKELSDKYGQKYKIIKFTGNGEPLINKNLPKMVDIIRKMDITDRIEITTNGSLLTKELSLQLINSGLTRLLISIQGITESKYNEICRYKLNMAEFIENIKFFYKNRKKCLVYIKTVDIALTNEEERALFLETYGPWCDLINIENIMNTCEDVDYNSIGAQNAAYTSRYGNAIVEKKCCDTLFMNLNIHSTGMVDCCGCKYPPHYIGNIFNSSLDEIWNGKRHRDDMIKHLLGKRNEVHDCRDCQSIRQYSLPEDNLDDHLDEIMERVTHNKFR